MANDKPESLFHRIVQAIGFDQRFFWTSLWLITGLIIILIPLLCADRNKINLPPAVLWAFACFVGGVLVGFVFGIPTIINKESVDNSQANATESPIKRTEARKLVEANTNLTQISDWLTKLIIGAGLVQLKELPRFISKISVSIGRGIGTNGESDLSYATVFASGIILAFSIYGFILGYLLMRIILTEIFS